MTNLVEALDVNRTVISAFINKTYGMNLNRYLNRWQMKELERLRSLSSNQGNSAGSLIERRGSTITVLICVQQEPGGKLRRKRSPT